METVVYLIRHSVRFNNKNLIEKYNTNQNELIKYEKIILSVTGEKRAEILSNEKELQNIDVVYTSNCVRTLQTAKYLLEKQNLKVNIDERFDERRPGKQILIKCQTGMKDSFLMKITKQKVEKVKQKSDKE